MSVRKGDRGEGKLQVLNKARELKNYSLGLVKNDKHFPKSTRWLYAAPIAEEVRAACTCIRHANSVYISDDVTREDDYRYRRGESSKSYLPKRKTATMHQERRTSRSFHISQTRLGAIHITSGKK